MAGTGAAVPSDAILDLKENAKGLDQMVNSVGSTFFGRNLPGFPDGRELLTIKGMNEAATTGNPAVGAAQAALDYKTEAQLYAEAAATNADWVYPDVASGEAARSDGDYFWVLSTDSNEVLELWQMGATTATDTGKRTNAKKYVTNAYLYSRDRVLSKNTFDTSVNLFNHNDIVDDVVILSDGQVSTNSNYKTTGFIEVKENTDYTKSGVGAVFVYAATYDINKNFIRRIDFTDPTVTTDDNEYFVRLSYQGNTLGGQTRANRMLNEGVTALPYELYYAKFTNKTLPEISTDNVAIKGIGERNASFVNSNENLYNPKTVTQGKVISSLGVVTDNANYAITDWIDVETGADYSKAGDGVVFTDAAFYDFEKNFITRLNFTDTTITAPAESVYMRLSFQGSPSADRAVLQTSIAPPYFARQEYFAGVSTRKSTADFIGTNYNLYDHNTTVGPGFGIDSDGSFFANENYSITDWIEIEPNTDYSITGSGTTFVNAAFYDKDKIFLERVNAGLPDFETITSPDNAVYMRMNFQGPADGQRQIAKGSTPKPYQIKRYFLKGVEADPMPVDKALIDIPITGVYSTTETYAAFGDFTSTTSAQVYQLYDDLMAAFPDYITKQFLGNDLYGNPISVYKFTPAKPQATFNDTRYPKVFLTSGVHGYEHVPGLVTYLFFKDICERWQQDSQLEALRHNVEFLIIPVANPSGWDDYTRKNRNGVDVNRNFPEGWEDADSDPQSITYRGPSPLSEPESQYISQVFDENPDIDIMYDFHNFSGVASTTDFIWVPTVSGRYVQHLTQMLVQRMTRKWRNDYTWFPSDETFFAGYTDDTHGAMAQDHAYARGIQLAATFEVCGRWWISDDPTPYNTEHKQSSVDSLTNWILINLEQLLR